MNTLIFSEKFDVFVSLTRHNPMFKMNVGDKEYFIGRKGEIVKMNDRYDMYKKRSMIRFVVSDNLPYTKVFDNVELYFNHNKSSEISRAWFETLTQVSEISYHDQFDVREDTHKLAIPRDVLDGHSISRMRGKYLISNYQIDSIDGKNEFFSIPYIKTRYRFSKI